jgi:hypothetical protein
MQSRAYRERVIEQRLRKANLYLRRQASPVGEPRYAVRDAGQRWIAVVNNATLAQVEEYARARRL